MNTNDFNTATVIDCSVKSLEIQFYDNTVEKQNSIHTKTSKLLNDTLNDLQHNWEIGLINSWNEAIECEIIILIALLGKSPTALSRLQSIRLTLVYDNRCKAHWGIKSMSRSNEETNRLFRELDDEWEVDIMQSWYYHAYRFLKNPDVW